ncbi:MAG: hypothetical protein AB7U85_05295 [Alphaproteobacteria bacterium]
MKKFQLSPNKLVFFMLTMLLVPNFANAADVLEFGNLIETVKLDANSNPVVDPNGKQVMRPLTNDEVVAKVKAVIEPRLSLNKLGNVAVSDDVVTAEIKDASSGEITSTLEINRKTGHLTKDDAILSLREEAQKKRINSIARGQKVHDRLQNVYDKLKELEETEKDSQNSTSKKESSTNKVSKYSNQN